MSEQPWYEQPITFADVDEAVARYAPTLDDGYAAQFARFVAETWEGVVWGDAGAWDMAAEWRRFIGAT